MIKITTKKWGAAEMQRAIDYYTRDLDQRQDGVAAYYYGNDTEENWKNEWQEGSQRVFELCQGPMTKGAFAMAMRGHDARTNTPLVEGGGEKHSASIDFCYSVPKSVSLAYAAAKTPEERSAIMSAIEAGNHHFLAEMKQDLHTRHGHAGKDDIGGVKHLCIASKTEPSSRNGDMQIHIHNNVMNMCISADGSRRCLDYENALLNRERYEAEAGAVVFNRLKELGYEIRTEELTNAQGHKRGGVKHELNRVSQHAIDENSSRQEEITYYMATRGVGKEYANKATKKNKQETGIGETLANAEAKIEENAHAYGFSSAEDLKGNNHMMVFQTDSELLEKLHQGNAAWTERDLKKLVAQFRGVELGVYGAREDAARMMRDLDLVPLKQNKHGEAQWAARAYFNMEQKILDDAQQMTRDRRHCLPRELATNAITEHEKKQGFQLSEQQRDAAYGIACEAGGIAILVGRAGCGKTTGIGAVVRAVEASGGRVYGASTADTAAAMLGAETGIECTNTKKLLNDLKLGRTKLNPNDKVLIDEAGMVGSQTIAEFQHHCRQSGASLLLVGDPAQIKPIEAGDPLRALIEDKKTPVYELTEIRRQQNENELRLSNDFYGNKNGQELRQELEQVAALRKANTREEAIEQAATYYAHSQGKAGPVMATTNEDVMAVNAAVRLQLKTAGTLPAQGRQVMGVSLGDNSAGVLLEACTGDRIAFNAKFKDTRGNQVFNNDTGKVLGFTDKSGRQDEDGRYMRVELDPQDGKQKGKVLVLDTQDPKHKFWNHAYAMTANKAQGQTFETSGVLLTKGCSEEDRGKMLVLCSRQKGREGALNVFATDEGLRGFERAAEDFAAKYNAKDLLLEAATPIAPPAPSWKDKIAACHRKGREEAEARRWTQHQERMAQSKPAPWSPSPEDAARLLPKVPDPYQALERLRQRPAEQKNRSRGMSL